ncbi:MAG: hypothetical protein ACLTEX_03190 [Eggerthella lenta]
MLKGRAVRSFPVDDEHPATSSGEVVVLEVTEVDEDGQPCSLSWGRRGRPPRLRGPAEAATPYDA